MSREERRSRDKLIPSFCYWFGSRWVLIDSQTHQQTRPRLWLQKLSSVSWYRCFSDGHSSQELRTTCLRANLRRVALRAAKPEPGQRSTGPLRISQSRHNSLPFTEYGTEAIVSRSDAAKQKMTLLLDTTGAACCIASSFQLLLVNRTGTFSSNKYIYILI